MHLVDITHDVAPHDIAEGALALEAAAPLSAAAPSMWRSSIRASAPRGGVWLLAGDQVFVGPDNGMFTPFLEGTTGAPSS